MRTIETILSPFVLSTLSLAAGLSVAGDAAASITLSSHSVTASDGAVVYNFEPGSLPSAGHPEGTVFALVGSLTDLKAKAYLAEIDVARSETIHRASFQCGALLRDKDRLYASCDGQLVAFEAATLHVVWQTHVGSCPGGTQGGASVLVSSGAGRLAAVVDCRSLYARVVRTDTGALLGGTSTGIECDTRWIHSLCAVFFHGQTLFVGGGQRMGARSIVALSANYARVERTLRLSGDQGYWDDGAHVHVSESLPDPDPHPRFDKPDPDMSDEEWEKRRYHGPSWLKPGLDVTLSDAFEPLSSRPRAPDADPPHYVPGYAGGEYTAYELDQGAYHFWLTRSCCGGDTPGGLWVGKRPE
jgi:hypothetical protein